MFAKSFFQYTVRGSAPRINIDVVNGAVTTYRKNSVSEKWLQGEDKANPKAGNDEGKAENGGDIALIVMYSCIMSRLVLPIRAPPSLTSESWASRKCWSYLFQALEEVCQQDDTWIDYNENFPLMGGVYANDCGLFSMAGVA
ncbi:MAG: Suppressor of the cold-sensitive snRNP biogenesis mutant brr1-1 [Stictis urceolatum]|nr:Suppressor of the cold-sensitive snRNP biogenesis mutant brr1-1 [Stictis urceolata]